MPVEKVSLSIGGTVYSGWSSVAVHRAMNAVCGTFDISMTDDPRGKDFKFAVGLECVVKIGDEVILTGFIDAVEPEVSASEHRVTLRGRDKTCDIVDCSVVSSTTKIPTSGNLRNLDLTGIAKTLCKPFGITVKVEVEVGDKWPRYAIQKGETVFEAIDRACKQRGVIPITDGKGQLVLTASGDKRAKDSLRWGQNIVTAKAVYDNTNRFSLYEVQMQAANNGVVGELWGQSIGLSGSAPDVGVKRFRPVIIQSEAESTVKSCTARAKMEALVRAANSECFMVMVKGWRGLSGDLWQNNRIVTLDVPPLYVNAELLVAETSYSMSNQGQRTEMKLMRPDAFNPGTKFKGGASNSFASSSGKVKKTKGTAVDWTD